MPYLITKEKGKWIVRNGETGALKGTHTTYLDALKQQRLLYGIKGGKEPTGKPSILKKKRYTPK